MKIIPGIHSRRANLNTTRSAIVLFAGFVACLAIPTRVAAGIVVTIEQMGSNVVATGSGTLNLTDLTFVNDMPLPPIIESNEATLGFGPSPGLPPEWDFTGISGPAHWGSGLVAYPSASMGDTFGIFGGDPPGLPAAIIVPAGYAGTFLSGTDTWTGATLSSLGLTPSRTRTYTWGSGPTADSFTVQVGPAATSVPEPATIWLAATGAAALAVHARFARSKHQRRERLRRPDAETE